MKKFEKAELIELDIVNTEVTYEKTPEELAPFGAYRYWDGVKWIYTDSLS